MTSARVILATLTTVFSAVGMIVGLSTALAIGRPGVGVAAVFIGVGAFVGGAIGRRVVQRGSSLRVYPVVLATWLGMVGALLVERTMMDCVIGDAVVWQCGAVSWAAAFGSALVGSLFSGRLPATSYGESGARRLPVKEP